MFCDECGAKLPAGSVFCDECGAQLGGEKNDDPWAEFADYKQPQEKIVEVEKPVVVEKIVEVQKQSQPEENEIEKYNEKLSKKELDKLEGTDDRLYFVHRRDKRTERQIQKDFANYFNKEMFQDYTIETNVPATTLDFSSNAKYCKPVNFLFKLGKRPVLAVHIARYNVAKHPVAYYVKDACKRRGIKYICFIENYPNKEHYVVRRVLEELGEIPYLYGKK